MLLFQGDDSSPASFEKTLSTLSVKITNSQARLDRLRATARRVKVLSTLYLSFAYLVYAIVLLLVVGWKNMGAYEWSGMAAGPVVYVSTNAAEYLLALILLERTGDTNTFLFSGYTSSGPSSLYTSTSAPTR